MNLIKPKTRDADHGEVFTSERMIEFMVARGTTIYSKRKVALMLSEGGVVMHEKAPFNALEA